MSEPTTEEMTPIMLGDYVQCTSCSIKHRVVFTTEEYGKVICWPCMSEKGDAVELSIQQLHDLFAYFYPQFPYFHINHNFHKNTIEVHAFKQTDKGHEVGYCELCVHKKDSSYLEPASDAKIYRPDMRASDHLLRSLLMCYVNTYLAALEAERQRAVRTILSDREKLLMLANKGLFQSRRIEKMPLHEYFKCVKWYGFEADLVSRNGEHSNHIEVSVQALSERQAIMVLSRQLNNEVHEGAILDFLSGKSLVMVDSKTGNTWKFYSISVTGVCEDETATDIDNE